MLVMNVTMAMTMVAAVATNAFCSIIFFFAYELTELIELGPHDIVRNSFNLINS